MDDLDKIDRLFVLKTKGALSEEEFQQEKKSILASGSASNSESYSFDAQPTEVLDNSDAGYSVSRKMQVAVGVLLLGLATAGGWFALGQPRLPSLGQPTLGEYVIGSWAEYHPKRSPDELCGTDNALIFKEGGRYSYDLDESGAWIAEGDAIQLTSGKKKYSLKVVRISDDRARFDKWEGFRCPNAK